MCLLMCICCACVCSPPKKHEVEAPLEKLRGGCPPICCFYDGHVRESSKLKSLTLHVQPTYIIYIFPKERAHAPRVASHNGSPAVALRQVKRLIVLCVCRCVTVVDGWTCCPRGKGGAYFLGGIGIQFMCIRSRYSKCIRSRYSKYVISCWRERHV